MSFGVSSLLFPETAASFFNSDPEFVPYAARWLSIMAIGYFSMSTVQVCTQAFNTSGNTIAPMIITLSAVWMVEVPLGFALSNLTSLGGRSAAGNSDRHDTADDCVHLVLPAWRLVAYRNHVGLVGIILFLSLKMRSCTLS